MSSPKRRIETDVMKMMMSDYEVTLINDNMQEFYVAFKGPTETPFQGGQWKVHVELPDAYPYKSPSIGFVNKIFHPNIDELSAPFPVHLKPSCTIRILPSCARLRLN